MCVGVKGYNFRKSLIGSNCDLQLTFEGSGRIQHNVNEEFRDHKDRVAELASIETLEVSVLFSEMFLL